MHIERRALKGRNRDGVKARSTRKTLREGKTDTEEEGGCFAKSQEHVRQGEQHEAREQKEASGLQPGRKGRVLRGRQGLGSQDLEFCLVFK